MKIRFTDGELKNRMFDVIEMNKDKTVVYVWDEYNRHCAIYLPNVSYQLFGFDEGDDNAKI